MACCFNLFLFLTPQVNYVVAQLTALILGFGLRLCFPHSLGRPLWRQLYCLLAGLYLLWFMIGWWVQFYQQPLKPNRLCIQSQYTSSYIKLYQLTFILELCPYMCYYVAVICLFIILKCIDKSHMSCLCHHLCLLILTN